MRHGVAGLLLLTACAGPAPRGPFLFDCGAAGRLSVTYPDADSMIARLGGREARLSVQPSASGARYGGDGREVWEHQGEARVTWGEGIAPMTCKAVGATP